MSKYDQMPPPIPDTPENIARICMQGPPKKEWNFLKKGQEADGKSDTPTPSKTD